MCNQTGSVLREFVSSLKKKNEKEKLCTSCQPFSAASPYLDSISQQTASKTIRHADPIEERRETNQDHPFSALWTPSLMRHSLRGAVAQVTPSMWLYGR